MSIKSLLTVIMFAIWSINTMADNTNLDKVSSSPKTYAKEVISILFNYDYQNYEEMLKRGPTYFSEYGWHNYKNGLEASNNINNIKQDKGSVSVKILEPINIQKENRQRKHLVNYDIEVTAPIVIRIKSEKPNKSQYVLPLMASLLMKKTSEKWIVESFTTSPPSCDGLIPKPISGCKLGKCDNGVYQEFCDK